MADSVVGKIVADKPFKLERVSGASEADVAPS